MDLTTSFEAAMPRNIRRRYDLRETRNAVAVIAATNAGAFADVVEVLRTFKLEALDITEPGGSKSRVPRRLYETFRELGWREGRHHTRVVRIVRKLNWTS